jgi:cyanophycinase
MLRCGSLVGLLLLVVHVMADDNLLGLPTPQDPTRPGAVVLHGGGSVTQATYDRFWELAGGKEARIVLIPCAGFRVGDYDTDEDYREAISRRYGNWMRWEDKGWVKSFRFLYTDDPADADSEEFCEPLESATGVWFGGGQQTRLNWRFVGVYPEQTRFQELLRGVLERGGVVGGTSAGMAALPEVATLRETRDEPTSPASAVAAHGLGLFNRAIVEQHFNGRGGRLERFTGLLRDNAQLDQLAGRPRAGEKMMGIAVEEGTALVVQRNRFEVVGTNSVHIFLKASSGRSMTWHELNPGDTAQLKREAPSVVLLAREELGIER